MGLINFSERQAPIEYLFFDKSYILLPLIIVTNIKPLKNKKQLRKVALQ
jgi:hypothetical protein